MPTDVEYAAFLKMLGARIKQLRKERKLSLRDVVVKHGYQDSQWRSYESGGSLNVRSLLRVAEVLRVPLSELVKGLERRKRIVRVSAVAEVKVPQENQNAEGLRGTSRRLAKHFAAETDSIARRELP